MKNGTGYDAAVRLVGLATGNTLRFFYVRTGESYSVGKLEPGSYWLRFATGNDWFSGCKEFLEDATYSEFEKPLVFKVGADQDQDEIRVWATNAEVTLNPVLFGNAKIRLIDRKRFFEGDQNLATEP